MSNQTTDQGGENTHAADLAELPWRTRSAVYAVGVEAGLIGLSQEQGQAIAMLSLKLLRLIKKGACPAWAFTAYLLFIEFFWMVPEKEKEFAPFQKRVTEILEAAL